MPERPNFLILMVDQLTGTFWENGPAAFLDVPHLRALHARSVNFGRAHSPSPLCTPARASFMTGMLPSGTTVYDNAAEFPSNLPTFAHYLRRAGYFTALSGKMHFVGADQLHGFEERLTTDIYPADFGWTPDWRRPLERIDWWYHNLASVTEAGMALTSNQLEYDDEVSFFGRSALLQRARRSDPRPFCLTVSFTHPHDPYTARPSHWARYEGVDIPAPAVPALDPADMDPHSARLMDAVDSERFDVTADDVARARRAYCANLSYLDDRVGELLGTLDETGLADDTVVVFCADHGDMLGERGLWYKMNFFEGAVRIPLSFALPGGVAKQVDAPVSALDVLPTLLELAGISVDELAIPVDGVSLAGALGGSATLPEGFDARIVASEYMAEGSVSPMLMLRQGCWKYIHCPDDPDQLFDLETDPHELVNLATAIDASGESGGSADGETNGEAVESGAAAALARLRGHRERGWQIEALDADVRENQQRRILVHEALAEGRHTPWDFQPVQDASKRFMRNHLDLNVVEATARVPVGKLAARADAPAAPERAE